MVLSTDPVRAGLVPTLGRPGGNVTGLSAHVGPEFWGRRLEALKELAPTAGRVAVLVNPTYPGLASYLPGMEDIGARSGLTVKFIDVRRSSDFDSAFAAMAREGAEALFVVSDPLTFVHRKHIIDWAAKNRLPADYGAREFVDAGGLMSYGVSGSDLFKRPASYVDKILKGAQPAELVINLQTAKALGLAIPQ